MNKELRAKTNEELCSLIMRLKLQLLESRFRMASGELEKTNMLPEIRKTIARSLTILNERGMKLSIGTHGITMHNTKTNEVKSITNLVQEALKATTAQDNKSNTKTETVKEAINEATILAAKKVKDESTATPPSTPVVVKKELKSHMDKKAEKQMIRKTVGGGS
ncbi:MAG: 50S ribosomal protein L29 [Mycoplasmataceae bacterium]|jgi:large subunit ribosomal protein L29|nr:50S ribosomal protein L29 [Mycoplasmataceae bacterium]